MTQDERRSMFIFPVSNTNQMSNQSQNWHQYNPKDYQKRIKCVPVVAIHTP